MDSPPPRSAIVSRAFDAQAFRDQGHRAVDLLADYLAQVRSGRLPVLPWQEPQDAVDSWQAQLNNPGQDVEGLIEQVLATAFHAHHPHNLGHQVGPALPAAAIMDLVASLLDTGNAVYEVGHPATPMERVVLGELARRIRFPQEADGVLTSGGSLGNLTAMLVMRECQSGVWEKGTRNEAFAVLVSSEAHYCVVRAAKIMGWGERGVIRVPVDEHFRLRRESLETALTQARSEGLRVLGVAAGAGSTATGRIDPLHEIADFCQHHQLWLHVDAAHAGAFVFSAKARPMLDGLERADSVVIDFHKMLLSPSLLTAVLFKRGHDSYQAFAQQADYLWRADQTEEWWDGAKRTLECTRPMLGLRAYALLKFGGETLFEAFIDQAIAATQGFAALIEASSDFEMLVWPESNIICYRYLPEPLDDEIANDLNRRIRAALVREGRFYIVQVEKRGRVYLRSAVMNPHIHAEVFEDLLDEIRRLATALKED